jgi:dihydrofolate synthase/folylpolyglutamate synthase
MDYRETLDWLFSQLPMYQRIGAAAYKSDLGNTLALLQSQGNPERDFRSVHIAGTNGKGSVAHLLAAILQEAGYKTGLYTSPHLTDFRERIRIQGEMIPEAAVVDYVAKYREVFRKIQPSFFEMTVGMAFAYFSQEKVDIAVIETGMGGRLDSTNVLQPEISIITNIGHDHQRFLGNDLQSIAREKAGIIKDGVPVVLGRMAEELLPVFQEIATAHQAPLLLSTEKVHISAPTLRNGSEPLLVFDALHPQLGTLQSLACPLTSLVQLENLATVLTALIPLQHHYPFSADDVYRGLRNVKKTTGLRGRWEVLSKRPFIVADTAHNPEGLRASMEQWMRYPADVRHLVLGMVDDKDPHTLLSLLPGEARYYFCQPSVPRGMPVEKLMDFAKACGLKGTAFPDVKSEYKAARRAVSPSGSIYIGGSNFVVADLLS